MTLLERREKRGKGESFNFRSSPSFPKCHPRKEEEERENAFCAAPAEKGKQESREMKFKMYSINADTIFSPFWSNESFDENAKHFRLEPSC